MKKLLTLLLLIVACNSSQAQIYADFSVNIPSTSGATNETIRVELDYVNAPLTVANFISLAEGTKTWIDSTTGRVISDTPYYDGIIFHRVISGFMIQGGSQKGDGSDGPGYHFPDEVNNGLLHDAPYILSMANSGPHTNGSQFFITVSPRPSLNGVHTVFGKVVNGSNHVDTINQTSTDSGDKPVGDVTINSVTIVRVGTAAQNFNEASYSLPEVSALCIPLRAPTSGNNAVLEMTQNSGTTLTAGFSVDLNTWTTENRYLDSSDTAETDLTTPLISLKGFSTPALVTWSVNATFPSSIDGKVLDMATSSGNLVADFTSNQTITLIGGNADGSDSVSNITDYTYEADGYGATLLVFSDSFAPIRLRLGADLPHAPDFAGRLSGTVFTNSPISLSGTFTIN